MSLMPNMFVVGATRCGTTSLYRYFMHHPDIYLPKRKELNYFNVTSRYGDASYYDSMMRDYRGQTIVGDISPMYMMKGIIYRSPNSGLHYDSQDSALRRLCKTVPNAKIIVTLRHPVDRYISQYRKTYYQNKPSIENNINDQIQRDIDRNDENLHNIIRANRYSIHVGEVVSLFDPENTRLIILEEWSKDPAATCRELFTFLGVDEDVDLGTLHVHNRNEDYNVSRVGRVLRTLGYRRNSSSKSDTLNDDLLVHPDIHRQLREILEPECSFVESLLERPIRAWHRTDG